MIGSDTTASSQNAKNCLSMDPAAAVVAISAMAAAIAQGKTQNEINTLAVIFAQLGDTLATISLLQGTSEEVIIPPFV